MRLTLLVLQYIVLFVASIIVAIIAGANINWLLTGAGHPISGKVLAISFAIFILFFGHYLRTSILEKIISINDKMVRKNINIK
jgi:hypothetical protein